MLKKEHSNLKIGENTLLLSPLYLLLFFHLSSFFLTKTKPKVPSGVITLEYLWQQIIVAPYFHNILYNPYKESVDNFRLQFTRYVYYIFYWKCIWIHLSQILILKFNSDDMVATYLPRHANFFLVYKRTRALIFTSLKDFSLWREIVFVPSSINNITIIIHYMPMSWEIWLSML